MSATTDPNSDPSAPTIFVIFGITGDLAQRKLLPALYHLLKDGLLDDRTRIVGLSRRDTDATELVKKVELCVLESDKVCDPETLERFSEILEMVRFNPAEADDYSTLKTRLDDIETSAGTCLTRLFYLSIPPTVYGTVVGHLGKAGLNQGCQHGKASSALLVEKPFGYDLTSAEELISNTNEFFDESQVYRIDHYLAKETAQNILTFRRENPLFRDIWDGKHISSVEVVAYEQIGIEGRGGFYDGTGALRDLIQSHLMQLLALTTMELPDASSETDLHRAKQDLLESIEPVPVAMVASRVTRGQYVGYQDEVQNPDSATETYAAVQLQIPTERWRDTVFNLATGKAMASKQTRVRLSFGSGAGSNQLTFRLQPGEGIDVTLQVKKPGFKGGTEPASLNFDYTSAAHPDAYERVLIDAIRGDHQLFASSGEVLASWRVLQPVLDAWQRSADDLVQYEQGSAKVGRP